MRRGPSSAWNSSTRHCVGGRSSSQSLVVPPFPTGPRSVVFGSCVLLVPPGVDAAAVAQALPRRGFGGGRGLLVASSGVPVSGNGSAGVSAGGVGGGGSTGGGGEAGGASVGGGGVGGSTGTVSSGASSGGGAARAAAFSRFWRWRRANLSQARQQRWTSTTKHSSFVRILPVGSPTSPPSSKTSRQRLLC